MADETETFEDASAEGEMAETESNRKRKKFHFSVELDVQLIETVLAENPYETPNKDRTACWKTVAARLDANLGTEGLLPRTCKDRVERLLAYFEDDHPCLKQPGNDNSGMVQHRLDLLEQLSKQRKEGLKDGSASVVKKAFRKSESQINILPRTSAGSVTYTYTALPITGTDEAEIRAAITGGFNHSSSSADEDTNAILVSKCEHSNGLDSNERSLLKQLLEARKLEETRRLQELEIRREELQMERMKLDFEKAQWEVDRKERESRLALEQQERKVILEFMKKTLTNSASQPSDVTK